MKKTFNISDILDYAYKSEVFLEKPKYEEIPDNYRSELMEHRIKNEQVVDWGFYSFNNDLVFVGGHQPLNNFTTETWSIAFDNSYRKTILKICKMFCNLWMDDFHRLQTLVKKTNKNAYKFNKLLGFKKEAEIEKLTEHDFYLLRRLRDNE